MGVAGGVREKMKVKVSGGVRTLEACQEWVQRGSGRIYGAFIKGNASDAITVANASDANPITISF
ncbi:hypothetical protein K443DRAFT_681740 [Laccaria amethystina LaAM-08-1]|uniref:Uncharacterized protein n=1 Tax=Laccaria amethystina LaAM-08-1 TaxID=1095629 RepID=A0A0C9WX03_9AGAR|nr:hypothetical protein K443DRAFT_681740 [Laccaria amethystina LaAM-08-1]